MKQLKRKWLGASLASLILVPALMTLAPADAQRRGGGDEYQRDGGNETGRGARRGPDRERRSDATPNRPQREARVDRPRRDSGPATRPTSQPGPDRGPRPDARPGGRGPDTRPGGGRGPQTGNPGRRPDTRPDRPRRPDTRPGGRGPDVGNPGRRPDTRPDRPRRPDSRPGGRGPDVGNPGRRPDTRPDRPRRPDSRPGGRGPDVGNPGRRPDYRRPGDRRPDARGPGGYRPDTRPNRPNRPGAHRPWRSDRPFAGHSPRRWDYAGRRHNFYHDQRRHESNRRWIRHLNHGWSNARYYGRWGPSSRWRYDARYYDHGYSNRQFAYYDGICRYNSNGDGAVVGALLGALIGGYAASDDSVGAGILLGAGFGAVLGNSIDRFDDCDRAQYQYAMNYAFEYGQPYYWGNPYSGVRGTVIIRETYYNAGVECRWGDAEIYMPDGTYNYDRVRMCRDPYGDWQVASYQ